MNGLVVRRTGAFFVLMALVASISLLGAPLALADNSEEPIAQELPATTSGGVTVVQGNPSCVDLGYARGIKDDSPNGDTTIDGVFFDYTGESVSVSSTDLVIQAVIVKGGNAANVYTTGPFQNLIAPINNGGQQAAISHVEACVVPPTSTTTTPTTVVSEPASVAIEVGYCRNIEGVSMTPVRIDIEPDGAASVTIDTADGTVVVAEDTELSLPSGSYTWSAVAAPGHVLEGPDQGSFDLVDCVTPDATVLVELGDCAYDVELGSLTEVRVSIVPAGAAAVVIDGPDGRQVLKGEGGSLDLAPGEYKWRAVALDGHALVGVTKGSFTVVECAPVCTAVIGDYVWLDMNPTNGLQDEGEEKVSGVVVHLLDAEGDTLATTVTDENGHYEFADLCEGVYRVAFELPDLPGLVNEAWTASGAGDAELDSNADVNGLTDEIVVVDGTDDMSWDAGIVGESVSVTTVTSVPPSTSTTMVELTTTTTVAPTTSTTAAPTTSTSIAPASTTTTVPPVTATTLPFTGFELGATTLMGLLSLLGGAALLAAMRRRPVEDGHDSIGGW